MTITFTLKVIMTLTFDFKIINGSHVLVMHNLAAELEDCRTSVLQLSIRQACFVKGQHSQP